MRILFVPLSFVFLACGSGIGPTGTGSGGASSSSSDVASSSASGDEMCPPGTKQCPSGCAPIDGPSTGCGAPGCSPCSFPNATAVCAAGLCALASCVQGWGDCNSFPTDGCETHTATDPVHCGTCGTVCSIPHATPACAAGVCVVKDCALGWQNCNVTLTDGCETDIWHFPSHCGSCTAVCPPGNGCNTGGCYSCDVVVNGGAGMPLGYTGPMQVAWKFMPTHDLLAKSVSIPGWPYAVGFSIRVHADSSNKPANMPVGVQVAPSTTLTTPAMLMAGNVYWIVVSSNTSPPKQVGVATVLGGPAPVYDFDGVLVSAVNPPQSPTFFSVDGDCP